MKKMKSGNKIALATLIATIIGIIIAFYSTNNLIEGGVNQKTKGNNSPVYSTGGGNIIINKNNSEKNSDNYFIRKSKEYIEKDIRFKDIGDGKIIDFKKKIMWKKCKERQSGSSCENGKNETLVWKEALELAKNSTFSGYNDWILPTKDFLKSLIVCKNKVLKDFQECHDIYPEIDQNKTKVRSVFPDNIDGTYWTETEAGTYGVWIVNFRSGVTRITRKKHKNGILLMRFLKQ